MLHAATSPFLKMVATRDKCHSLGTDLVAQHNRHNSTAHRHDGDPFCNIAFQNSGGMPSAPQALFRFKLAAARTTSSSSMVSVRTGRVVPSMSAHAAGEVVRTAHCTFSKYSAIVSARHSLLTSSPARLVNRPCVAVVPFLIFLTTAQSPVCVTVSNHVFYGRSP